MTIEVLVATADRFDVATILGPGDPSAPACRCLLRTPHLGGDPRTSSGFGHTTHTYHELHPTKAVRMLGWVDDITKITLANTNFRTVVYTAKHTQLTLMSLNPGEDIGWESHPHLNQFLRLEQGKARVEFGRTKEKVDETHQVEDDWAFIVPAGVWHNVVNVGTDAVKLYSLYSPPQHPEGTVHRTRADADAAEGH